MATGNVAEVEFDAEATMPTDFTMPNALVVLSLGVIWACRPFLTEARSALLTVVLTVQLLVEMTTMSAVELVLVEAAELFEVDDPAPADPPEPPLAEPVP